MPGTTEVRSHVRARRLTTRPLALAVLVVAVVGTTAGWKASEKTVTVSVDGSVRHLSTHAGSVRGLLQQAHLAVGPHDLLAPAAVAPLADGATVVLRHGRSMTLVVDGVRRDVWVTANSVDEALGQIGLRTEGALLSADRSRAIPLRGFSLDVRTAKAVTVVDAGRALHVMSTGLLLSDALAALHVSLRPADRIDRPVTTPLTSGLVVHLTRLDAGRVNQTVAVRFVTVRRADPTSYVGTTRVGSPGRAGVRHRIFALRYRNHQLVARRLLSDRVTSRSAPRVVLVGARQRPVQQRSVTTPTRTASSSGSSSSASSPSVSSSGGLNWGALANCESGGNPRAVSSNGLYRGLYQFSIGTWQGVGGSGDPINASSGEQTQRAQILYGRTGRSSWPVCGRYL